jgi:hypothetical protein
MAAFTVALNSSNDAVVVAGCLEVISADFSFCLYLHDQGLVTSVHIACMFMMTVERDAFVKVRAAVCSIPDSFQSLANFTNLSTLEEIKFKHVEAIRTLLTCAVREVSHHARSALT